MDIVDKRITPFVNNDSRAQGYELCVSSGVLAFQMSDNLTSFPLGASGGPDLRDGSWHHVAVTVDRNCTTGGRLYVDGAVVNVFNPTSRAGDLSNTNALLVAMHPSSWLDCNFRGGIDEVSFHKRVLTFDEIAAIRAASTSGKCNP